MVLMLVQIDHQFTEPVGGPKVSIGTRIKKNQKN